MGFFSGFQLAIFAFVGVELVGSTAAESVNPEKSLPRAINLIPIRLSLFYISAIFIIVMVMPWSSVLATSSPFVQIFLKLGLPAAASIVNFVILIASASSANSGLYSTSRMLYGLSLDDQASKKFSILSKFFVPHNGVILSAFCMCIGVLLFYKIPNFVTVFSLVTTLSSILFIFVWAMIVISYLAYRKKQPHLHAVSKFALPGGVITCWFILTAFVFILILLGQSNNTSFGLFITPLWFIILFGMYFFMKHKNTRKV
jgi:D-serine/D-alanine/glycine transporter